MSRRRLVCLAGGVGAARFLAGLCRIVEPTCLTVVGNTADDVEVFGLHVCPDLDSIVYALSDSADRERGWGLANDTFHALEAMRRFTSEVWFQLGDRDLATHLFRTQQLRAGEPLSAVTAAIASAFGVACRLLPMSDDPVHTRVRTPDGWLAFQDYFVRRGFRDDVLEVHFAGADTARPGPGVLEAIAEADAILIAPSNPFVSVAPILAVPGVRAAIEAAAAPVVAITPIVGGKAIKGPAASMLRSLGHEVSALAVARLYAGLADAFVLDSRDQALAPGIAALGLRVLVGDTLMTDDSRRRAVAELALRALD